MKKIKNIMLVCGLILILTSLVVCFFKVIEINNKDINIANNNSGLKIENDVLKDNIVLDIKTESDYIMPESLNKESSYIVIGKINSIDGGINYNKSEGIYTVPQTIGSIEISEVIKGEIKDKVIPFIRVGGMITFEEYENGLVESQKTKLELCKILTPEEKKQTYVSIYEDGDIKPEEGKEYLMYLCYDEDYNRYNIQYLFYGLREVKTIDYNSIDTFSMNEIKVKNNLTGDYETLSEVLSDLKDIEK